jgi:predicted transcriptional regulator
MKPLLIQLDEQTLAALNRVASPDKRQRSEFVRQAIRKAVRLAEYRAMRDAYRKHPDSARADDWSTPEEFKPLGARPIAVHRSHKSPSPSP